MSLETPLRLTGALPGSGGVLRRDPEDFCVAETLPYALSGEGEHLFVRVRKRGLDTLLAARRLAETWQVIEHGARLPEEAGMAGLKDRHAVAEQWLSYPWPLARPLPDLGPAAEGIEVLEVARHRHKLRKGHVAANRFEIVIREAPGGGLERARETLSQLRLRGLPNRFGAQRFGMAGDNAERALEVLLGRAKRPRDRRVWSLLCSALQSEAFNRVLDARIEDGSFGRALDGDRMVKHDSGGQFVVDDPDAEQVRMDALEISPTAPLPGKKTPKSARAAAELEARVIGALGIDDEVWRRVGMGARRPLRIPLGEEDRIEPGPDAESFVLHVTLPSGSYATAVLDELVKPTGGPFRREEPPPREAAPEG